MALPPENALKTHCEQGHPLSGSNLYLLNRSDGRTERVCRECARRRLRKHHRAHYVPHPRPHKPKPAPKGRTRKPLVDRILARLDMTGACWVWQGAKQNGYGIVQVGRGQGTERVHRAIYRLLVEPIPDGLTVDHLCFESACCNPDHLEVVTRAENTRRQWDTGHAKAPRLAQK